MAESCGGRLGGNTLAFIEDTAASVGGRWRKGLGGKEAYREQRDLDAELLIERGRDQLEAILGSLEASAGRAKELQTEMAEQMRARIQQLEIEMAEMELQAAPAKARLEQLQKDKDEATRAMRGAEANLAVLQRESAEAAAQSSSLKQLLEDKAKELREAIAREKQMMAAKDAAEAAAAAQQSAYEEAAEENGRLERSLANLTFESQVATEKARAEAQTLKGRVVELEEFLVAACRRADQGE